MAPELADDCGTFENDWDAGLEGGRATEVGWTNRSVSNCFRRFAKTVSRERGEASGRRAGGGRAGGVRQTSVAEERLLRRVFRIVIAVSGIVKHGRRREPCARLRKRRGTFRNFGGKGRVRDREGLCNCFELILPQGCCGNDTDRGGMTEGRGGAKKRPEADWRASGPEVGSRRCGAAPMGKRRGWEGSSILTWRRLP